jgi:lipopolysaccharide transport system ATP-binding protein
MVGGEKVSIIVDCLAHRPIHSPIIGFFVRDRLGQTLFGDNTYLSHADCALNLDQGDCFTAEFVFRMPILPVGEYSLTVAVAEGTQQNHIQHHWIHDALFFKSHTSSVCTGLVGIAMESIVLKPSMSL